nr:MAG TPA: hypothetical protein [Caudoviricetes sp.]
MQKYTRCGNRLSAPDCTCRSLAWLPYLVVPPLP